MRWKGRRQSDNVEDRRGSSGRGFAVGGRGGGGLIRLLPLAIRFLGIKGTLLVVLGVGAYFYFSGGELGDLLGGTQVSHTETTGSSSEGGEIRQSAEEAELMEFVSVVLADTELTWHNLFAQAGKTYREPRLVVYRGMIDSACGMGQAAMGPFYCPGDHKVYLDFSFFDELRSRYGVPGDFAQAYVIAHEIGHHVQTLFGISARVMKAKQGRSKAEVNKLSVLQELQADCFAGIWGHHADSNRQLLEKGDIEEGLKAASAIGDDRLQKRSQGYITPESFTHGTSAQRVHWFRTGLASGDVSSCNTFGANWQ
ncbi:zinc metalloprotease [Nitrosococcus oceani ATCC 19707]|uniref:Zinc metalloprotease n=2 Tax=Nitrosococcus oceani TaxID=1229 RepID=Q3J7M8_NITOC|nr:neutral zinc metallopeptidase [Nitrosococcus oceani]ABA59168.1 zinc metalloprotease [Nitrosococcus oceani ATCC 19707]KFI18401.1 membrane protein [Nitrosococcus oceani C-27]GEM20302.1 hypothetical protein NONS58_17150 [Nitrosococcus oceani]